MGRTWAAALLVALPLAVGVPGPASAGDPPPGKGKPDPLAAKVREAIAKGVAWVRKQQATDGHFHGANGVSDDPDIEVSKIYAGHRVGESALALHALRSCGVPAEDPLVTAGFAFLRESYRRQKKIDGLQTYDIAFVVIALDTQKNRAAAPGPKKPARGGPPPVDDGPWLKEMTAWLVGAQGKTGGFGYTSPGFYDTDVSNTQIALLALQAARRSGAEVPQSLWQKAMIHLLDAQESAGPACVRRDETWRPPEGNGPVTVGAEAGCARRARRSRVQTRPRRPRSRPRR